MKLIATIARKLGMNKGAPRVWLEGLLPQRAGFAPGKRYRIDSKPGQARVVLTLDDQGVRLVSTKQRGDKQLPVIDLNSHEVLGAFAGMNAVRVIVTENAIHIVPAAVEVKKLDRAQRLLAARASGEVITASVSHGGGVLSHALHTGLRQAGLTPKLSWACEIREEMLEQAGRVNTAWDEDTVAVAMPLQDLAFADEWTLAALAKPIILEAGIPCTAASLSGRSKKGLAMAEDDEEAGHLVAGFIGLIARTNPVAVLLENVRPWFRTASASILRTSLKELGYAVQERDLDGEDFAIEARPRHVLLAVTEGFEVDLSTFTPAPRAVQTVGQILDPIGPTDPSWSAMQYLRDKEVRDKAAGKGFAMNVATTDSNKVGTLGTGYQKNRSTEPKVPHPTDPQLLRLFTPAEHARLKGIPPVLIDGIDSKTFAHELLGQSVIWPAFAQMGRWLGDTLLRRADTVTADPAMTDLFGVAAAA